jgi:hypothetical protein
VWHPRQRVHDRSIERIRNTISRTRALRRHDLRVRPFQFKDLIKHPDSAIQEPALALKPIRDDNVASLAGGSTVRAIGDDNQPLPAPCDTIHVPHHRRRFSRRRTPRPAQRELVRAR